MQLLVCFCCVHVVAGTGAGARGRPEHMVLGADRGACRESVPGTTDPEKYFMETKKYFRVFCGEIRVKFGKW